jgi:radical SAM superfamily enzyme YgiQ (UPF0313 family)
MENKKIVLISTDGFIQHGLRSISAVLKKNGFDVHIIFFSYDTDARMIFNSKEILKSIKDIIRNSLIVGISTNMQVDSPLAIWLFNQIKDMNIPLIWGGIYPTINPEDCIKHVDILCRGEGEYTTLELVKKLIKKQPIENIANLWVKKNGEIIKNPPRELITDINILPFPDIDSSTHYYLDKKEKKIKKIENGDLKQTNPENLFCVHGTRGCPLICSYCSNKAMDTMYCGRFRRTRKRNVNLIIEELKIAVKKLHPQKIWFSDDIFTLRTEEELKLFSEMYKKYIHLPFMCYVSPTTISETKIKYLVDAGINSVEMGIQSGSDYINKEVYERQQTKKDVLQATKILSKFGNKITPKYQFILFNKYEKEEDILETIDLIKKIPEPYNMQCFTLSLFKGSELYNRYLKDGYLSKDYKMLDYLDADIAFWKSINKMSNRKHYLYTLLWFMIYSTKFRRRLFPLLRNDKLVKRYQLCFVIYLL